MIWIITVFCGHLGHRGYHRLDCVPPTKVLIRNILKIAGADVLAVFIALYVRITYRNATHRTAIPPARRRHVRTCSACGKIQYRGSNWCLLSAGGTPWLPQALASSTFFATFLSNAKRLRYGTLRTLHYEIHYVTPLPVQRKRETRKKTAKKLAACNGIFV